MKISLNWLRKYVDIDISDEDLIRTIGARLVEVEGVIDETHKYDSIYIVRVEKAEKIPDTHLTLCQVNVGDVDIPKVQKNEDGLVQVVCGAPNVREGMLAVWIAPGAVVPASVHEDAPFVIGKRKMLGKYESNGMLAGADELDFDDKHEKIAEVDPAVAQPGDSLAEVFGLNDKILDIENKSLTHRPDCFGVIGFAREVAGILGKKFVEPDFLHEETVFPEGFLKVEKDGLASSDATLDIEIVDTEICPRYTGAVLKVTDATAEDKYLSEMRILIAKSGMMPVSRIVDVTNYLMLLTGQPLHAFDYDKFLTVGGNDTAKIVVREAQPGETLELLDDKTIECIPSDILITSNGVPVALAGAMGGKNTEIDENTKNILLEAATFSLYHLRKTQMAHGIFTEAITRFTKGVPMSGTFNVLAEAVKEMNAKPLELRDKVCVPFVTNMVEVSVEDINRLLGTGYSRGLIIKTLENVGFMIVDAGDSLQVAVPAWRTDIHIKEDIIEEVGRLLGYDNIVPTLPLHQTAEPNKMWELKKRIREMMRRLGANELLTYSFVAGRLLERAGQDPKNSYKIVNSISPELQYVRQSIVPSLLDKAYVNQKIPFDKFALYEMNKVYQKEWGMNDEKVPVEKMQMGMVLAERKGIGTAYYKAKIYMANILDELNITAKYLPMKDGDEAVNRPFEPKRSAIVIADDGAVLGVVGEFKNSVRRSFKLAEYTAGFELNLDTVLQKIGGKRDIYLGEVEKRDLTVKTTGTYAELIYKINTLLMQNSVKAIITPISIYQPEGAEEKNISVHLEFHQKIDDNIMEELEKLS
ncbi:MAG: phenylalanine--tRNA ligase subunit beta [Candidatus Saccharimonadaceae bacterium]|nr:phenylalanine--tRNA ligase subunit beta [Candidatus Saccharimonadaceae bacterium]